MSILVILLRAASLLAFAAPRLARARSGARPAESNVGRVRGNGAPVLANAAAFGLFFMCLLFFAGKVGGRAAPVLAASGCLLAGAGAVLVFQARTALGPAWSLTPAAGQNTGLVTSGPYRLVRHPIYLGLSLIAAGQAIASRVGPPSWSCLAVSSPASFGARSPKSGC